MSELAIGYTGQVVVVRKLTPIQQETIEADIPARLRAAALQLGEAKGFEQVTVDEITTRAALSRRTFFRYFSAKEDVLFSDHAAYLAQIRNILGSTTLDTAGVVEVALDVIATGYLENRHFVFRRRHLVDATSALKEREALWFREYEVELSALLRSRRGVLDPIPAILAAALVAALRYTVGEWLRDPAGIDLPRMLRTRGAQLSVAIASAFRSQDEAATNDIVIVRTRRSVEEIARALAASEPGSS